MKINRCQFSGKVVEMDLSYIPGSGTPVLKLRVLIDDGYYDTKESKYIKRNVYRTVKYINKLADKLGIREDDYVFVEGANATDKWQDRDGNDKWTDFIRATALYEIPNPWDLKESSGGDDRRGGYDNRRDDRGGSRRDDRRDSRRDSSDRGRDDRRPDSRRDDRPSRDYPEPDDKIPF